MLSAAMLVGTETGRTPAQGAPPDLRMLMNLDLFEPRPSNGVKNAPAHPAPANAPSDDSMLNQIRTLDAMGYLGNHADAAGAAAAGIAAGENNESAPAPSAAVGAPAEAPAPAPSSQPSYDVEGPQP